MDPGARAAVQLFELASPGYDSAAASWAPTGTEAAVRAGHAAQAGWGGAGGALQAAPASQVLVAHAAVVAERLQAQSARRHAELQEQLNSLQAQSQRMEAQMRQLSEQMGALVELLLEERQQKAAAAATAPGGVENVRGALR